MLKNKAIFILSICLLMLQSISAKVCVNGLFADNMVVQRSTSIPVWGWANPNEKVSITSSWGAKAEVVTKADSTWSVKLKTPKAGGPYSITISGENTLVLNNVLSGEVWLCTGQSNMDFALEKFINNSREAKYQPLVELMRKELAEVNDPWLRHIEVPHTTSLFTKIKNFEANWVSAIPGEAKKISATGYFFAKELRKKLNVPVGLVECDWGGTRIQPWISEETYMQDPEMKAFFLNDRASVKATIAKMKSVEEKDTTYARVLSAWEASDKKEPMPYPKKHPAVNEQIPATLYNGMLSAVIPYAIKGVIWYQGESNSHYMEEEYGKYFRALIHSWRADWGQGDMPFYWMQLAAYNTKDERSNNGWALVNDHLRRTMSLPNTGMAVLHDIGEGADVHPHNKMDAGKRLALWALKNDYKQKLKVVSGPLYQSYKIKNNVVTLKFKHVGSGLMVGNKYLNEDTKAVNEPLKWFEIAGEDGLWKKADANIISKNKIEVSNVDVKNPIKVRYAWASNPEGANLYNKEGLPAAVFSTEDL